MKVFRFTLLFFGLTFLNIQNGYSIINLEVNSGGPNGSNIQAAGSIYYYVTHPSAPSITSVNPNAFITFTPLNITYSHQSAQGATIESSLTNMFRVRVTSTAVIAPTATQQPALIFYATNAGVTHPAPIAAVNGYACDDPVNRYGNGNCFAFNQFNNTLGRFYAARFPKNNTGYIDIGFYPSEICDDLQRQGVQAPGGCTGSAVTLPTTSSSSVIQLSFAIVMAPVGDQNSAPPTTGGTTVDSMTSGVNFYFEVVPPTFTCASDSVLNSKTGYLPGDGQIFLNTSNFAFGTTGAGAPASVIKVVGNSANPNTDPIVNSNFESNEFKQDAIPGIMNAQVKGFTNSADLNNLVKYKLGFIGKDAAGVYASPTLTSPQTCFLSNVSTASSQGVLGKNDCFIATAAFGSADAWVVGMLREFRDRILLKSEMGRNFVHWYYGWSPQSASWLKEHSLFRLPVLQILVPLELGAWFLLHPMSFFIFLAGVCLSLGVLGSVTFYAKGKVNESRSRQ